MIKTEVENMIKTEVEKISKNDLFTYGKNIIEENKQAIKTGINTENAKTKLDVFLTCVFVLRLKNEFENYLIEKEVI